MTTYVPNSAASQHVPISVQDLYSGSEVWLVSGTQVLKNGQLVRDNYGPSLNRLSVSNISVFRTLKIYFMIYRTLKYGRGREIPINRIIITNLTLNFFQIGDRIGVKRSNAGNMRIFINGEDLGVVASNINSVILISMRIFHRLDNCIN